MSIRALPLTSTNIRWLKTSVLEKKHSSGPQSTFQVSHHFCQLPTISNSQIKIVVKTEEKLPFFASFNDRIQKASQVMILQEMNAHVYNFGVHLRITQNCDPHAIPAWRKFSEFMFKSRAAHCVILASAAVGVRAQCVTDLHNWHVLIALLSTFCLTVWLQDDLDHRTPLLPFSASLANLWFRPKFDFVICDFVYLRTQSPSGFLSQIAVLPTLQPCAAWELFFVLLSPLTSSPQRHSRGCTYWALTESEVCEK